MKVFSTGIYILACSLLLFTSGCKFQKEVTANVCQHKWGMKASMTQTTDRYLINGMAYAGEFYGLKYNIPLTVFEFKKRGTAQNLAYKMGRVDFAVYSNTCSTKVLKSPKKHIEQYVEVVTELRDGKVPLVISYGCGKNNYLDEINHLFLMGRNSYHSNDTISFNAYKYSSDSSSFNLLQQLNRPSTTRYFHMCMAHNENRMEVVKKHLIATYNSGGFYTDFSHWQAYKNYKIPREELALHFKNLGQITDTMDIYRGSYNTIAAYYYLKKTVDHIKTKQKRKQICLSINTSKKDSINYDLINTPISVLINLKGTRYEGLDFESTKGNTIRKLENGNLVVNIDLNLHNAPTTTYDTLNISKHPIYMDFSSPNVVVSGSEVNSNQPIKITVFRKPVNGDDTKITVKERRLIFSSNHRISTVREPNYRYYIGYINELGNSGLIEWKSSNENQTP